MEIKYHFFFKKLIFRTHLISHLLKPILKSKLSLEIIVLYKAEFFSNCACEEIDAKKDSRIN